ncbi:PREDICTED: extensin-like [Erythranthe guttata]|uniref:extensin-like n=1 Tax=Erythranthe guttata TaxID=4155 RepID=UPI00064E11DB|nr:PREDICTED: extensin-like [Erythranthe guttata]|eukprot:XP_012853842.1 PREDICTED: extensin-like [Erythranthe guttata]
MLETKIGNVAKIDLLLNQALIRSISSRPSLSNSPPLHLLRSALVVAVADRRPPPPSAAEPSPTSARPPPPSAAHPSPTSVRPPSSSRCPQSPLPILCRRSRPPQPSAASPPPLPTALRRPPPALCRYSSNFKISIQADEELS